MKKITAALMCLAMLVGLAIGSSAAGEILFTDDFTTFSSNNWILDGNKFFHDTDSESDPCISAYKDGVVCQMEFKYDYTATPRLYTNCAMSVRVKIRAFDGEGYHRVGLWWRDDFHYVPEGQDSPGEDGEVYRFYLDADNQTAFLEQEGIDVALQSSPCSEAVEGSEWVTIGWRIVPGNISCYVNNVKVVDYSSAEIAAVNESPILLLNHNCFSSFDDVVVATADYDLFNEGTTPDPTPTEGPVNGGDDNNNGGDNNNNAVENTTRIDTEIVTDAEGNKSVVTKIVTNAPTADTNKSGSSGGSATATGDAAFMVTAIMIVALGCAIVVKKVNVK